MTLFGTPVPTAAIEAFAGIGGSPRRLRELGLLVPSEDLVTPGVAGFAANGLAVGRVEPLTEAERAALAKLALPALFAAWGGSEGRLRRPMPPTAN
jgi:hypothetical protein